MADKKTPREVTVKHVGGRVNGQPAKTQGTQTANAAQKFGRK